MSGHSRDGISPAIRELAEAGGICLVCGALHVPDADTALLALDTDLPWCDCAECRPCTEFREALRNLSIPDEGDEAL